MTSNLASVTSNLAPPAQLTPPPHLTSPGHIMARQALYDKYYYVNVFGDFGEEAVLHLSQLEELGIHASPLDLDDAENSPHYFLPMSAEKLSSLEHLRPDLDTNVTEVEGYADFSASRQADEFMYTFLGQFWGCRDGEQEESCLMYSTRWRRPERTEAFERALRDNGQGWWMICVRLQIEDHSHPHMIVFVNNGDEVHGEPLVRSDLLCAVGIIIDTMGLEWSQSYRVFPVLLLSFFGERARIIETYFDGSIFHFRYSPYFDLADMDKADVDWGLRWMLSYPVGDTGRVAPTDDSGLGPTREDPSKPCSQLVSVAGSDQFGSILEFGRLDSGARG